MTPAGATRIAIPDRPLDAPAISMANRHALSVIARDLNAAIAFISQFSRPHSGHSNVQRAINVVELFDGSGSALLAISGRLLAQADRSLHAYTDRYAGDSRYPALNNNVARLQARLSKSRWLLSSIQASPNPPLADVAPLLNELKGLSQVLDQLPSQAWPAAK